MVVHTRGGRLNVGRNEVVSLGDWDSDRDHHESGVRVMKCGKCRSTNVAISSYPGMAGWASPVEVLECFDCGNEQMIGERIIFDEDGDIA